MTLFYILLAAIALGILIFIHELGHYFMARLVGMKVEVFSIGFGKPILKWRLQDVDWQLGWIPFGGYVKIMGMEIGKNEKEKGIEPHDIPNGFFAKSPFRRILVAVAGPVANLILALLIFTLLYFMGGREKHFSEYTHAVGYVSPTSEIYAQGLRPGDIITHYNDKEFTGSKDHLYAAMLGGGSVKVDGYHFNYSTKEKIPFTYKIESYQSPNFAEGIKTTGILSGASYAIYDKFPHNLPNPLPEGSPMEQSGIAYGDRIVWANGETLFSQEQLRAILNDTKALLTIERNGKIFLSRQPRVKTGDLIIFSDIKSEYIDWQYETGLKKSWNEITLIPYNFSSTGIIEHRLRFIDDDAHNQAFPLHPFSEVLDAPLMAGDRIVAVDGIPVNSGYEILKNLQEKRMEMIVKQGVPVTTKTLWTQEDTLFEDSLDPVAIQTLANEVGLENSQKEQGAYKLLAPVMPRKLDELSLSPNSQKLIALKMEEKQKQIQETKDAKKREVLVNALKKSLQENHLGIYLQDKLVVYNPPPLTLFSHVFTETWMTLKALVSGYLHLKWMSGPVGIVTVIQHGWQVGIGEALFWIGAISVNLGFVNLLPIPVLDGGYIFLSLCEMFTRKRLKAKTMERIIVPFMVILIALLIFLTFQDISRFF